MDTIEIKEGSSSSDDDEKPVLTKIPKREDSGSSDNGGDDERVVEFDDVEDAKPKKRKKLTKKELRKRILDKKDSVRLALKLPDIVADREKERALTRVATIGVVQLFNAVSERQKEVEQKLIRSGKKMTKHAKKEAVEQFDSSDFHKRLSKANTVKEEVVSDQITAALDDDTDSGMDVSGIKTEPESEED